MNIKSEFGRKHIQQTKENATPETKQWHKLQGQSCHCTHTLFTQFCSIQNDDNTMEWGCVMNYTEQWL